MGDLTFYRDIFRTVVNFYIQALGVVITYEKCKSSLKSSEDKVDDEEKTDVIVSISSGDMNGNFDKTTQEPSQC
jgi:hypothetical protein